MRWEKVDQKWLKWKDAAPGTELEYGVTFTTESWEIPGEAPLEVRVCSRKGFPYSKFSSVRSTPKTSIVMHITAGYPGFYTLMGNDGSRQCSAHFLLARDGTAYLMVPTEYVAWHATWWNENSVGIEVDCIGQLFKKGADMCSGYGDHDAYCKPDETNVFWEIQWPGRGKQTWATWTEDQYRGMARLLKAISHKHQIPRIVLPEPTRYTPFLESSKGGSDQRKKFKGLCTHLQIDPQRRADIGPFIDWDKLIRYADYQQGDCYNAPAYAPPTNPTPMPGGPEQSSSTPANTTPANTTPANTTPANTTPANTTPAQTTTPSQNVPPTQPTTTQEFQQLPAPTRIDDATVRVSIGKRGGRVAFTVRKPGEPVPTAPKPGDLPPPQADGKRDEFIRHAMNFLGAPYKSGSFKPHEGLDGVALVAICLKRVGLLAEVSETLDGPGLFALWGHEGGSKNDVPPTILPGDIAWFGVGDHETVPTQHPMIWMGGGRLLGPVPNGGEHDGAVQIIRLNDMPDAFAGWSHIDDLGVTTTHSEHPGENPAPGTKLTGALLPLAPAARYDALKAIVEKKEGKWLTEKNAVNLVGIKNMGERCLISPTHDGWNDELFAAFLDDDGHKCCLELKSSLNPENDQDPKETWQLQEGSWEFKIADGEGTTGAKVLQPAGKIKGWKDLDGSGAPRGGDLLPPEDPVVITKLDPLPEANPAHPNHPDNLPPGPMPTPYSGPLTARSTGAWEEFIGKDEALPDAIVQEIVAARGKAPKVAIDETKFGSYKGPNIRVHYHHDGAHLKYLKDFMGNKIAAISKKTDKFVANCFRTLLGREGNTADLNLYDNMIVTWGTGFGANNGGLMLLMDWLQNNNEGCKNILLNVGFWYDHPKRSFHIVDTDKKKVVSSVYQLPGKQNNHKDVLELWRTNDPLLYTFTALATAEETRDAVTNANLWTYTQHSGTFPAADRLDSQGAFNFISHLFHWCPGYAANCVKNAIDAGQAANDLQIVTYSAQQFVRKAKAGTLNLNWNQLKKMWNEMKVDGLDVPSADDVDFGI